MTTLLESLGFFTDIFDFFLPFLLVFAIVYALLMKTKYLSESANINAVIAFAIGLIVALSGAGRFIVELTPFLAVLFVIVFLMFLTFLFFGAKPEWIFKTKGPAMIIVLLSILFVFYVLGSLYGGSFSELGNKGSSGVVVEEGANGDTVTVSEDRTLPSVETCDFAQLTTGEAMACLMGNPKVLGTIILLSLLAIATFFVVYVPKNQ